MRDLKLAVLLVATLAAIAACGGPTANVPTANNAANRSPAPNGNSTNTTPAAQTNTAELDGKGLYTENCQICHRDTGKGGPVTVDGKKLKPDDLTKAHMKAWTDAKFVKNIEEGSPDDGMPAFKDKLKADEIAAIVSYIRTLQ